MAPFPLDEIRARFPALERRLPDGRPIAWLDGPAGTQVPRDCLTSIDAYLRTSSSNTHGAFAASEETDLLLADVHAGLADLLGATDPREVSVGANMTTITFAMSRAIARTFAPGDEIVVTRLDHDANIAPWLAAAEERELRVRWVDIDPSDCTLDTASLDDAIGERTRLVAVGLASNAVGTINPVADIARRAHAVGALVWVDAVHAAPHMPIDVTALGADFLVCSAYKFYGPHLGVLWGRRELLETLPPYRVRPAGDALPGRYETGTQAHELLAGLGGTLRYLEWLGVTSGGAEGTPGMPAGRRGRLVAALEASREHERGLVIALIDRVAGIAGLELRGITDPRRVAERCPTIAFTLAGHRPREVAEALGREGIFVWDGDYYAWELMARLGVAQHGGMVRVGLVHYSTADEVERLGRALEGLARA